MIFIVFLTSNYIYLVNFWLHAVAHKKEAQNFELLLGYIWCISNLLPPHLGAPGAGRTRNQLIRSQVLYPLSYEGNIRDYTRY